MTSEPMSAEAAKWFVIGFPFFFILMWTIVTTLLGYLSGWFSLQAWYADDRNEPPLLKLGWQSGSMGFGVNFSNCLTLAATRSGFSLRVWRVFGLFQRPLLIPWSEITVTPKRFLFIRMVRLEFGHPPSGSLRISQRTWNRLVAAVGRNVGTP